MAHHRSSSMSFICSLQLGSKGKSLIFFNQTFYLRSKPMKLKSLETTSLLSTNSNRKPWARIFFFLFSIISRDCMTPKIEQQNHRLHKAQPGLWYQLLGLWYHFLCACLRKRKTCVRTIWAHEKEMSILRGLVKLPTSTTREERLTSWLSSKSKITDYM